MTVAAARAAAEQLRVALLDNGVRQVSLELQPGVGPKADPWGVAPFVRGLGHHIASYPTQGLTPGLGVVKGGRKGASPLQGPLANCYGGFDLVARIITMGWANHPGEGGPWSVPGWGTVPKDDGRPRICGWEFEGGYIPYTDEMHDFMARCGAGTLDWLGWLNNREPAPLECWGEHKDPWAPGRKVDRIGYTAASGRARIAAVRGTNPQEDDLDATEKQLLHNIAVALQADRIDLPVTFFADRIRDMPIGGAGEGQSLWAVLAEIRFNAKVAAGASGDVDEQALAAELAPLLPAMVAAGAGTMSTDQLKELAGHVADALDLRTRDGDPATGPVS